jgi:hypothetical protein
MQPPESTPKDTGGELILTVWLPQARPPRPRSLPVFQSRLSRQNSRSSLSAANAGRNGVITVPGEMRHQLSICATTRHWA